MKPYSAACEQNRDPILSVFQQLIENGRLPETSHILEIGSGTGQHAVYFGEALPTLTWQCSDQAQYHPGINAWLGEAQLSNVLAPIPLNASEDPWPTVEYEAIYSANVMHIMHWENVVDLFSHASGCLKSEGLMMCYGPFNYENQYTSQSNAGFDQHLRMRDPKSGIRNFEDLQDLAEAAGLTFYHDYEMPANNRVLVWKK